MPIPAGAYAHRPDPHAAMLADKAYPRLVNRTLRASICDFFQRQFPTDYDPRKGELPGPADSVLGSFREEVFHSRADTKGLLQGIWDYVEGSEDPNLIGAHLYFLRGDYQAAIELTLHAVWSEEDLDPILGSEYCIILALCSSEQKGSDFGDEIAGSFLHRAYTELESEMRSDDADLESSAAAFERLALACKIINPRKLSVLIGLIEGNVEAGPIEQQRRDAIAAGRAALGAAGTDYRRVVDYKQDKEIWP